MAFREFLTQVKNLTRKSVRESEEVVRSFRSDIKPLEEAVTSVPISQTRSGFINAGEEAVGVFNKALREGDLRKLLQLASKDAVYTTAESESFLRLIANTPERTYKNVAEATVSNVRSFPQLNIFEVNFNSLTKSAERDIAKVESNLFKYFATGTKVTLTIGVIVVGTNWVLKATEERKGCFMLTTINNKTSSCKVQQYSCVGSGGNMCNDNFNYLNATLALIRIAELPDDDKLKIAIAKIAKTEARLLKDNLGTYIDGYYTNMYNIVKVAHDNGSLPALDYCKLSNPTVENGVIPPCRLCDPAANPLSTSFIDPAQYADNITFQCVANPSILETISDAIIATGENLLDGITSGLSTLLKPILIGLAVILVVVLIITIIWKVIKSSAAKITDSAAASISSSSSSSSVVLPTTLRVLN